MDPPSGSTSLLGEQQETCAWKQSAPGPGARTGLGRGCMGLGALLARRDRRGWKAKALPPGASRGNQPADLGTPGFQNPERIDGVVLSH